MRALRSKLFFLGFGASLCVANASAFDFGQIQDNAQTAAFRQDHRFGLGLITGGAAGVFGIDSEINITEYISAGITLGTGVDYWSWGLRARYSILAKYVNPFLGIGYAHWSSDTPIQRSSDLNPRVIVHKLLSNSDLEKLSTSGFSIHTLAPQIGIQFLSTNHYAVSATFHILVNFLRANVSPYGEVAAHWFF